MSKSMKSLGILIIVAALTIGSTVPASAWNGGYGYRPHGYYRYRSPSVVVVPRVVVPFGVPYVYPPVVCSATAPGVCPTASITTVLVLL